MLKTTSKRIVDLSDWDNLVKETYGKPYSFQQQNGCQDRGMYTLDVYAGDDMKDPYPDSIPEKINGDEMGVSFKSWLKRDPNAPVNGEGTYTIRLFWDRNFYPDIEILANDLYKKGLLEEGEYVINIDW